MQRNNDLDELIQLSFRTEERAVLPLVVHYFSLQRAGYSTEEALLLVGKKVEKERRKPYRSIILDGSLQEIREETAQYKQEYKLIV